MASASPLGAAAAWIAVLPICDNGSMFANGADPCEHDVSAGMVYLTFGAILGMRTSAGTSTRVRLGGGPVLVLAVCVHEVGCWESLEGVMPGKRFEESEGWSA